MLHAPPISSSLAKSTIHKAPHYAVFSTLPLLHPSLAQISSAPCSQRPFLDNHHVLISREEAWLFKQTDKQVRGEVTEEWRKAEWGAPPGVVRGIRGDNIKIDLKEVYCGLYLLTFHNSKNSYCNWIMGSVLWTVRLVLIVLKEYSASIFRVQDGSSRFPPKYWYPTQETTVWIHLAQDEEQWLAVVNFQSLWKVRNLRAAWVALSFSRWTPQHQERGTMAHRTI
jgi:hypothetical protein